MYIWSKQQMDQNDEMLVKTTDGSDDEMLVKTQRVGGSV
jgi:hypothetical protein